MNEDRILRDRVAHLVMDRMGSWHQPTADALYNWIKGAPSVVLVHKGRGKPFVAKKAATISKPKSTFSFSLSKKAGVGSSLGLKRKYTKKSKFWTK